jgi:hypothetical protein
LRIGNASPTKDCTDPAVAAQEMANVQKSEPIIFQARACIRNNILAAYQSGVYGDTQVKSRCFGPFSAGLRQLGFGELADPGFPLLVLQEVAPEKWEQQLNSLSRTVSFPFFASSRSRVGDFSLINFD